MEFDGLIIILPGAARWIELTLVAEVDAVTWIEASGLDNEAIEARPVALSGGQPQATTLAGNALNQIVMIVEPSPTTGARPRVVVTRICIDGLRAERAPAGSFGLTIGEAVFHG